MESKYYELKTLYPKNDNHTISDLDITLEIARPMLFGTFKIPEGMFLNASIHPKAPLNDNLAVGSSPLVFSERMFLGLQNFGVNIDGIPINITYKKSIMTLDVRYYACILRDVVDFINKEKSIINSKQRKLLFNDFQMTSKMFRDKNFINYIIVDKDVVEFINCNDFTGCYFRELKFPIDHTIC